MLSSRLATTAAPHPAPQSLLLFKRAASVLSSLDPEAAREPLVRYESGQRYMVPLDERARRLFLEGAVELVEPYNGVGERDEALRLIADWKDELEQIEREQRGPTEGDTGESTPDDAAHASPAAGSSDA